MSQSEENIQAVQELARAIDRIFQGPELDPEERALLGGWLFPTDSTFVRLVAHGLRVYPELFAGFLADGPIEIDHQGLKERVGRADEMFMLSDYLHLLAERVRDSALVEKSAAIEEAMGLVKKVRKDAADPYIDLELRGARRQALALAEKVLADRQRRYQKKALKARRNAADENSGP